jgi:hypothetical protein
VTTALRIGFDEPDMVHDIVLLGTLLAQTGRVGEAMALLDEAERTTETLGEGDSAALQRAVLRIQRSTPA